MNDERVGQVWRNKLEWHDFVILVVGVEPDDLEGTDNVLTLNLATGEVEARIFDDIEDDENWERLT